MICPSGQLLGRAEFVDTAIGRTKNSTPVDDRVSWTAALAVDRQGRALLCLSTLESIKLKPSIAPGLTNKQTIIYFIA